MGNKVKELEEEIARLEREHLEGTPQDTEQVDVEETTKKETPTPTPQETVEEEPLSSEERNWKKRFGDLRRHSQKKEADFQREIDELKERINKAPTEVPTSEEEIRKWAETNPKAAAIIKAIAGEQAEKTSKELKTKFQELEASAEEIAKEKELVKIRKKVENFDEVIASDDFHDWVEKQRPLVQNAVYEGAADDVIWAINLYTNSSKPDTSDKDAARAIGNKTRTTPSGQGEGRFSESQVARMSSAEWEKNEEAITKAIREGKFVYDLSSAR